MAQGLEVGCGTGHWLADLSPYGQLYGLDRSPKMLDRARARCPDLPLVHGNANRLPFPPATFGLLYCVNALHHFDDAAAFIDEAGRVLRPGGRLSVTGMDPHGGADRWYLYDFFPRCREADLQRYPSGRAIAEWMAESGFVEVSTQTAVRIRNRATGREVLSDPILQKQGTSQLALLTDEQFSKGMQRIETALRETGPPVFETDIRLGMVTGRLPDR